MKAGEAERLAKYPNATRALEDAIALTGPKAVARIDESNRATDLALALSPARLAVVRCVEHTAASDYTALATMVAEGDFVWAGLVFSEHPSADGPLGVETFHVSELPRLIERLNELRQAAS